MRSCERNINNPSRLTYVGQCLKGDMVSIKISRLYNMDIYSDVGKYLGKAQEFILDLEKGEILRITLEPLGSITREDAKRILREKSILYKNVRSVEDVIMVSKGGPIASETASAEEAVEEEETATARSSFFGRR